MTRWPAPIPPWSPMLSAGELEVLKSLSNGKRPAEIAEAMGTSVGMARQWIHRIMDKLGATTQAGAVATAMRRRIIN